MWYFVCQAYIQLFQIKLPGKTILLQPYHCHTAMTEYSIDKNFDSPIDQQIRPAES